MEYIQYHDYEIINNLLDTAEWSVTKRTIDTSNPKLYYFWSQGGSILQDIRNLELISLGFFYVDYQGYAVWESVNYRSINKTVSSATFDNTMSDMVYELSDREIFNEITVRVRPMESPSGSGSDKTCKYTYSPSFPLSYNVTNRHRFFTDPGEEASSWGTPAAEITMDGVDVTAQMVIYKVSETATDCLVAYSNTTYDVSMSHVPRISWLSVDYTPLLPTTPDGTPATGGWAEGDSSVTVEDSTSITAYGRRTKEINLPFPMSYEDALSLAEYYLSYFKDPIPQVKMKLVNQTDAILTQMLARRISDRITVLNTELGLNADFYINKEEHMAKISGLYHEVWWTLEKATGQRSVWALSYSALGTSTKLAP